jgi:hypothetical protein
MKRLALIIAATAISGALANTPARASCQRTGFNFNAGTANVRSSWRVLRNEPCSMVLSTRGTLTLGAIKITERPAHGVAGAENSIVARHFAYQPASGYLGRDHFAVTMETGDGRVQGSLTIDVDVEVVDKR